MNSPIGFYDTADRTAHTNRQSIHRMRTDSTNQINNKILKRPVITHSTHEYEIMCAIKDAEYFKCGGLHIGSEEFQRIRDDITKMDHLATTLRDRWIHRGYIQSEVDEAIYAVMDETDGWEYL